jgi:hypothetical protein
VLIDEHLPYPTAIQEVCGAVQHRRRRHRGRKKYTALKAPAGLLVGVVRKLRDAAGRLLRVTTRAFFGQRQEIRRRIARLRIGHAINASHLERLNGPLRGQQTHLTRRTRKVSRREERLDKTETT